MEENRMEENRMDENSVMEENTDNKTGATELNNNSKVGLKEKVSTELGAYNSDRIMNTITDLGDFFIRLIKWPAVIIVVLILFGVMNILWKPTKAIKNAVDDTTTMVVGEREEFDKNSIVSEKPVDSYSSQKGTVTTYLPETNLTVLEGNKEKALDFLGDESKKGKFKRDFMRESDKIIKNRQKEAKKIFNEAISRIPSFVDSHYDERNIGERFVNLMNSELLSDETLYDFLVNTALEIDSLFYDSVSKALDDTLLSLDLGTDTLEELKKRLPTAREICNQIYLDLMNKKDKNGDPAYTKRKSESREMYEDLSQKHPILKRVGEVGFVAIVGFFFPPSLIISLPALAVDIRNDIKVSNVKSNFRNDLVNNFEKQSRNYQKGLETAIKDISKCYVDLVIKAKVKVIKGKENKLELMLPEQVGDIVK